MTDEAAKKLEAILKVIGTYGLAIVLTIVLLGYVLWKDYRFGEQMKTIIENNTKAVTEMAKTVNSNTLAIQELQKKTEANTQASKELASKVKQR